MLYIECIVHIVYCMCCIIVDMMCVYIRQLSVYNFLYNIYILCVGVCIYIFIHHIHRHLFSTSSCQPCSAEDCGAPLRGGLCTAIHQRAHLCAHVYAHVYAHMYAHAARALPEHLSLGQCDI